MGTATRALVVTIALAALFTGQGVWGEEDGDGGCPPLSAGSGSVRVVCEEKGRPGDCKNPKVGTVARSVWKKNVLKQGKGVTSVLCQEDGTWKKNGGGGGSSRAGTGSGYEKMGEVGTFKVSMVAVPLETAEEMCRQDGAKLMTLDSEEKMEMVDQIKKVRNPFFVHAKYQDDIHAGITNRDDQGTFRTVDGKSTDNIPRFNEKGGKAGKNSCVVYNMIQKKFWIVNCGNEENRGFLCEMPK